MTLPVGDAEVDIEVLAHHPKAEQVDAIRPICRGFAELSFVGKESSPYLLSPEVGLGALVIDIDVRERRQLLGDEQIHNERIDRRQFIVRRVDEIPVVQHENSTHHQDGT